MSKYLDKMLSGRQQIDAVFISHLHADHVNGLEYLLDRIHVRYFFLPQLTDDQLAEAILYNYYSDAHGSSRLNRFILDLWNEDNQKRGTRIVRVSPYNEETDGFSEALDLLDEKLISKVIKSGTSLTVGKSWFYMPYNPTVSEDNDKSFLDYIKENLGIKSTLSPAELPDLVEKYGTQKIRNIYRLYFGSDHNAYSMALFSGIFEPEHVRVCESCLDPTPYRTTETPNCLYTGDFDCSRYFKDLKSAFNHLWDDIKSVQIPHHGSKSNFHPGLYSRSVRGFVCVGEQNKYHHPDLKTILGVLEQGCLPVFVTERESSMKEYEYLV